MISSSERSSYCLLTTAVLSKFVFQFSVTMLKIFKMFQCFEGKGLNLLHKSYIANCLTSFRNLDDKMRYARNFTRCRAIEGRFSCWLEKNGSV